MSATPGTTGRDVPGKVVVVGQGYVGLPLAMRAVEVGLRRRRLRHRRGPGQAPRRRRVLRRGRRRRPCSLAAGRVRPLPGRRPTRGACAGFDVAVITVPTPLREGAPDLSYIEERPATLAALPAAGRHRRPRVDHLPGHHRGAGRAASSRRARASPPAPTSTSATAPSASTPATPTSDARQHAQGRLRHRRRLAGRGAGASTTRSSSTTVPVSTPKEAELTKLLENTFRHVNIALVNELAMFAADLGIDVWEAIDAASTKPFGYMRFTPGPGRRRPLPAHRPVATCRGGCGARSASSFRFVELANDVNDHMPDYVVRRLVLALNRQQQAVNGSRILLLGLAYKRNTGDARESPAVVVAERLLALGAEVRAADPHVRRGPRRPPGRPGRRPPPRSWPPPTPSSCSTDHDAFDLDAGRRPRPLRARHPPPPPPRAPGGVPVAAAGARRRRSGAPGRGSIRRNCAPGVGAGGPWSGCGRLGRGLGLAGGVAFGGMAGGDLRLRAGRLARWRGRRPSARAGVLAGVLAAGRGGAGGLGGGPGAGAVRGCRSRTCRRRRTRARRR